jgi:hypothetical protein
MLLGLVCNVYKKVKYLRIQIPIDTHMKTPIIIGTVLLALFVVTTFAPFAAAQYAGVGGGGGTTLEEQLALARAKVTAVQNNPHAGSGTPYLDANGVVGASVISGGIFGGIFIAFVVKAKQAEKAKRSQ